ncbi:MAG: hypothetical protein IPF81_18170 [Bacteroidetes bacterium]|nr:hypothetical protein [Bacteroidota bacterium]
MHPDLFLHAPALFIQFKQNGTATQFRIDDVVLTYSTSQPSITSNGPLSFCREIH